MTSTTSESRTTRVTSQTAAVAGLALAGLIIFAGNHHVAAGENGGLGPALITGIGCLLVTAVLYRLVLPRTRASNRTAIVLATLCVLSLAVFWSGLTPVLTAAALAATSNAAQVSRAARIAQAAAGLATALALAVSLASSHLL